MKGSSSSEEFMFYQAVELASRLHRYQVDKAGRPYIFHPMAVAERVAGWVRMTIAVSHDVVEDTTMTLKRLRSKGFSDTVVAGIDGVSRRDGETYRDYIIRCSKNEDSREVKLADLDHNLSRINGIPDADVARSLKKKMKRARVYLLKIKKGIVNPEY